MSNSSIFKALFLIGRPAAGKSEIIDFLKGISYEERRTQYHIGSFREIDDFPMIWTWFEEDDILTRMGKPRLHADEQGYFRFKYLWQVLIERLELDYWKEVKDSPSLERSSTAIIEFARGKEHGGFREAFSHLSARLLERSAVLYINVSFEESLRKNRRRFNAEKPYSILEHSIPDEKLTRLYGESDWEELSVPDPHSLLLQGIRVPYVVFENEDDVTTGGGKEPAARLKACLRALWENYNA